MPRVDILLEKARALDAVRMPIEDHRPVAQIWQDHIGNAIVVADDVSLGETFLRPEDFVEMGQGNLGHDRTLATSPSHANFFFPHHIRRRLVASHPDECWMTHLSVLGPFREFHLANELRPDPGGRSLIRDLLAKRLFRPHQRFEPGVERLQARGAKPGSGVANIAPSVSFAERQHQRAEMFARSFRPGESGDDHFLASRGLDLHPIARAPAGTVAALRLLPHDAFEPSPLRPRERLSHRTASHAC